MKKSQKPVFKPVISYKQALAKAESIVKTLTIDERIELIGGHNFFYIKEVDEANLPKLYMTDATQGVNIRRDLPDQMEKSVAFPCPLLLASTWNTQLSHDYAKSIGEECRAGGAHFLLGPGMNIYRISQNGRNFEYFGEDPFLAARMIENYVVGMQSTGTIATLKHFVANNTDYMRRKSNSVLGLRELHEIYLPAFKAGIEAGVMAVMTSYNLVNGEYAAESSFVINDLLREQLGYKWLVMSDWWSIYNPEKAIKSGLDIDMPGHGDESQPDLTALGDIYVRSNAKHLLNEGKVAEGEIDRMAQNILATSLAMGFDQRPQKDISYLNKFYEHEKVALQTAREGIVLLRNDTNLLPLNPEKVSAVLLTGQFVEEIPSGGGAATVEGYNNVTMLKGLQNEFGDKINYKKDPTDAQIKSAETIILSIGTLDSEGWDSSFDFQESISNLILRYAALNKNIIVVVNSGGGRNMTLWNNKVKAILYSWYPGQIGYKALAEIISGKVNPSGKLPITIEKQFKDSPGYPYIPEGESLYSDWPNDFDANTAVYDVAYDEGIMVGYRWYDHKQIEPLYHFGHGLSYSKFEYSNLLVKVDGKLDDFYVSVKFELANTGKFDGAEVAQIYVADKESSVIRPKKELKAFKKQDIEKNKKVGVEIHLQKEDFAFYDIDTKSWKVEAGDFEILVGSASNNIKLKGTISFL
ncbi:MAG: glycoside hydrolase family 3 C-terminal domain-containing protein [Salinivirgaceae bacterium]|jgi:beta-glucosidase|nr:glycoside hydrolase family 3 C-terminal domain-containing protein [Salinivirgaceae bacterium]